MSIFTKLEVKVLLSLSELLKHDSLDNISVQTICENANISRSNFYNYYKTKEQILATTYEKLTDYVSQLFLKDLSIQANSIIKILSFMQSYREILKLLLDHYDFERKSKEFLGDILYHSEINTDERIILNSKSIPKEYAFNVYTAVIHTILMTWIENNMDESPEVITHYILETIKL